MKAQINQQPTVITEIAEYSQTAAALSDLRHRFLGAYQIQRDQMATS